MFFTKKIELKNLFLNKISLKALRIKKIVVPLPRNFAQI